MKRLCEGYTSLVIWDRAVLKIILQTLMNFAKYPIPKALCLLTLAMGPKLKITKENASSWNKMHLSYTFKYLLY
jgi:hypothetical protein